jgi:hypothetical protein
MNTDLFSKKTTPIILLFQEFQWMNGERSFIGFRTIADGRNRVALVNDTIAKSMAKSLAVKQEHT